MKAIIAILRPRHHVASLLFGFALVGGAIASPASGSAQYTYDDANPGSTAESASDTDYHEYLTAMSSRAPPPNPHQTPMAMRWRSA
jgi:hypothetical protein